MSNPTSGSAPVTNRQILASCPLFAELPAADLAALAGLARRSSLAAGEPLFLAGEDALGIHIVVRGKIRIFLISPATGREVVLSVEHPFQTVAELVALDGGPYPASAEAAEDSELLIIEQARFQQILRERPAIAVHLLQMLGRRLRRLVGLVEAISFQEVVHRLASYLLEKSQDSLPFTLDTNAQIAAELGTVPELVSRNLARLSAAEGLVMAGRTVNHVNREQLQEMAQSAGR